MRRANNDYKFVFADVIEDSKDPKKKVLSGESEIDFEKAISLIDRLSGYENEYDFDSNYEENLRDILGSYKIQN